MANRKIKSETTRAARRETNGAVFKIVVAACAVFLTLLIVIDENGKLIDYCGSPEFIESYAREYFDMVYRGEIIIGVK